MPEAGAGDPQGRRVWLIQLVSEFDDFIKDTQKATASMRELSKSMSGLKAESKTTATDTSSDAADIRVGAQSVTDGWVQAAGEMTSGYMTLKRTTMALLKSTGDLDAAIVKLQGRLSQLNVNIGELQDRFIASSGPAKELVGIFAEISKASEGSTEGTKALAEDLYKLTLIMDISKGEAAAFGRTLLQDFNISGDAAQDLTGKVAQYSRQLGTSMEAMTSALSNPTAMRQMGLTAESALDAAAALEKAGLKGAAAGTMYSKLIGTITSPRGRIGIANLVGDYDTFQKKLGTDSVGAITDLGKALLKQEKNWGGTALGLRNFMKQHLGYVNMTDKEATVLLELVKQEKELKAVREGINIAVKEGTATQDAYNQVMRTLDGQLSLLNSNWGDVKSVMGEVLGIIAVKMLQGLNWLIGVMKTANIEIKNFTKELFGVEVSLLGIVGTVIGVLGAFIGVLLGIKSALGVIALLKGLGTVLGLTAGKASIIVTVVKTLSGILSGVFVKAIAMASTVATSAIGAINASLLFLAANPIVLVIAAIVALVGYLVYLEVKTGVLSHAVKLAGEWWGHLGSQIKRTAVLMWENAGKLIDRLVMFGTRVKHAITDAWLSVWDGMYNIWDAIVTRGEAIKAFWVGLWDGIADYTVEKWTRITAFWGGLWDDLVSTISSRWTNIKAFWVGLWDGVTSYFSEKITRIKSFWSGLWSSVKNAIPEVKKWLWSILDPFKAIGNAVDWIKGKLFGSGFLHINEGISAALGPMEELRKSFRKVGEEVRGVQDISVGGSLEVATPVAAVGAASAAVSNATAIAAGAISPAAASAPTAVAPASAGAPAEGGDITIPITVVMDGRVLYEKIVSIGREQLLFGHSTPASAARAVPI